MLLRHAAHTDTGRMRDHNEDCYVIELGERHADAGALFVVCDGMGGYARGEVASALAAEVIVTQYYAAAGPEPELALAEAFQRANREVLRQGGGEMGTTGVAALFRAGEVVIANVGDCRAYLVRAGQPHQITRDHSFVAEQVEAGMLTAEEAERSSYRHIITRAIGQQSDLDVDLFHKPLQQGDVIVLCSDGLHGQVNADEIALAVTKVPLEQACHSLVKLANERGGPDNITIVAVAVDDLASSSEAITPDDHDTASPSGSQTTRRATQAPAAHHAGAHEAVAPPGRSGMRRSVTQPPALAPVAQPTTGSSWRFGLWLASTLLLASIIFGTYYAVMHADLATSNRRIIPPLTTPTRLGSTTAPARTQPEAVTSMTSPSPASRTATPGTATPRSRSTPTTPPSDRELVPLRTGPSPTTPTSR